MCSDTSIRPSVWRRQVLRQAPAGLAWACPGQQVQDLVPLHVRVGCGEHHKRQGKRRRWGLLFFDSQFDSTPMWPFGITYLLIFIHGTGAHKRWWDPIAPQFLDFANVIAVDLPGMGNSSFRKAYSIKDFGECIISIIEEEKSFGNGLWKSEF